MLGSARQEQLQCHTAPRSLVPGTALKADGVGAALSNQPRLPETPLIRFLLTCLLYRAVPRSASVCHAHRTAAVPQLGARRLLPHQRQSRKALHVVNYVTEHAPVAYKDLSVGECGQSSGALHAVLQMLQLQQLAAVQLPHELTMPFILVHQVFPRRLTTWRSACP